MFIPAPRVQNAPKTFCFFLAQAAVYGLFAVRLAKSAANWPLPDQLRQGTTQDGGVGPAGDTQDRRIAAAVAANATATAIAAAIASPAALRLTHPRTNPEHRQAPPCPATPQLPPPAACQQQFNFCAKLQQVSNFVGADAIGAGENFLDCRGAAKNRGRWPLVALVLGQS